MGPYMSIWVHVGPMWDHMGTYGSIYVHMGPYGSMARRRQARQAMAGWGGRRQQLPAVWTYVYRWISIDVVICDVRILNIIIQHFKIREDHMNFFEFRRCFLDSRDEIFEWQPLFCRKCRATEAFWRQPWHVQIPNLFLDRFWSMFSRLWLLCENEQ